MRGPTAAGATRRGADLTVLAVLVAFVIVYCADAVRASTDVLNLILVLPVSVVVLVLCAVQFVLSAAAPRETGGRDRDAAEPPANESRPAPEVAGAVPGTSGAPLRTRPEARGEIGVAAELYGAGLFAVYVLTLPWLGFDLGTALFLAVFLRMRGERRWTWLAAYSIAFALALSFTFSRLLPYEMPLRLLGAA